MTNKMVIVLLLILCCAPQSGLSQTEERHDSTQHKSSPYPVQLRLNNRKIVWGLFKEVRGDTLVLLVRNKNTAFPFAEIGALNIERDLPNPMRSILPTAILAGYAAAALAAGGHNVPFQYSDGLNHDHMPWIAGLIGGLTGGYLVSLLYPSYDASRRMFAFTGDAIHDERAIEELKDFVHPVQLPARVHLRLYGGFVSTRSGLFPGSEYYYYDGPSGVRMNFARRVQLSYSITQMFDAGVAVVGLSEPPVERYDSPSIGYSAGWNDIHESLSGSAYLLVAGVEPLVTVLPHELAWRIEGGIGYAHVSFFSRMQSTMYIDQDQRQTPVTTSHETRFDESRLGLMIGSSVDVYLYDLFSIGLTAEYTYAMGPSLPAVPVWNVPATRCGSSCIGINFGLHY
ncbi:MAG TPA: hypothetical protein VK470_08140 [Bacteroidota bacterium]|nr:hypothetical protein [Bacteroidota bacterium]